MKMIANVPTSKPFMSSPPIEQISCKTICKVLRVSWKGNNMEIYCKMLQCLIDANTAVPMIDIANGLHLDTQDATSRFEYMLGQGWILPSRNDAGKIRITNAGRQQCQLLLEQRQLAQDALQSLQSMDENMRRNHAEEKAEKAKDRRFQLVNTLLGALAGALATLAIEHASSLYVFLQHLFH